MSEEEQNKDEAPSDVESKEVTEEEDVESKEVAKEEDVEASKKTQKLGMRARTDQNVVYVGNKPPMNYVMAVITAFNMGNGTEVTLKARGRAISTAVDVAEITRNRFFKDLKVHAISIGTEEITPREGGNPRNVSTVEICLKK